MCAIPELRLTEHFYNMLDRECVELAKAWTSQVCWETEAEMKMKYLFFSGDDHGQLRRLAHEHVAEEFESLANLTAEGEIAMGLVKLRFSGPDVESCDQKFLQVAAKFAKKTCKARIGRNSTDVGSVAPLTDGQRRLAAEWTVIVVDAVERELAASFRGFFRGDPEQDDCERRQFAAATVAERLEALASCADENEAMEGVIKNRFVLPQRVLVEIKERRCAFTPRFLEAAAQAARNIRLLRKMERGNAHRRCEASVKLACP